MDHLMSHYAAALSARKGLDLVSRSGLHLTTQGVGFADEVSASDVGRIVDQARRHCATLTPLAVNVGPAHIEPETVKMLVLPAEAIIQVRLALRRAIGDVWGESKVPESMANFRPHVTLAYSNVNGPSGEILAALEACGPRVERVKIHSVSLIDLNRDHKRYEWSEVVKVQLGS